MSSDVARVSAIDSDRVRHLAELARLKLTEAEVEALSKQMTELIGFFNHLGEVDVTNVPPANLLQVRDGEMRPDEVQPSLDREEFLSQVPARAGNFVRVAPVFGAE
jgi:aspartyl-tRNA(Asn)/glutamyl-tRNA(Gln) amidotransferase subunit C